MTPRKKTPKPPDIVGASEAAEILGITRATFKKRHERGMVPKPVVVLACGPIWLRSQFDQAA